MTPSNIKPCPECGFRFQCICQHRPTLSSQVNIVLLLHPNEVTRETNTGKLISQCLPNCQTFTWDRTNPPPTLLQLLSNDAYSPFLLFPTKTSSPLDTEFSTPSDKQPLYVLLDSTWQEAKKMVRKSPWLKRLPCVHFAEAKPSEYSLRRNQEDGHLCTSEAVSELLRIRNEATNATALDQYFKQYLAVYQADKSGHKRKQR